MGKDYIAPGMLSSKQILEVFIIQGVEGLYDEEVAEQIGLEVEAIQMLRLAKFTGILVAPYLYCNVIKWLSEKRVLLSEVGDVLGK